MRSSFLSWLRVFRWVPVCVVALCVIVVEGSNSFCIISQSERCTLSAEKIFCR